MQNDKIPVNIYASVYRAYIHPTDVSWMSFKELVQQFEDCQQELENKEDGALFNCCTWVESFMSPDVEKFNSRLTPYDRLELIRRCKENVDKIYVLLLDIDGTQTLEEAVTEWIDYEFFIYSTHSNTTNKDKFRLIVPLKTPLTKSEFNERHSAMCDKFKVDGASFTISQAFYLPCYSSENKKLAFMHWNETANRYDALELQKKEITSNVIAEKPDYSNSTNPLAKSIYNTLVTGSGLRYIDSLTLATVCKSKDISCQEFKYIVQCAAAPDSSLRTKQVDLDKLYQEGFCTFVKNDTVINLMKKLNCEMWRWQGV
jgi:hypothetical protein